MASSARRPLTTPADGSSTGAAILGPLAWPELLELGSQVDHPGPAAQLGEGVGYVEPAGEAQKVDRRTGGAAAVAAPQLAGLVDRNRRRRTGLGVIAVGAGPATTAATRADQLDPQVGEVDGAEERVAVVGGHDSVSAATRAS